MKWLDSATPAASSTAERMRSPVDIWRASASMLRWDCRIDVRAGAADRVVSKWRDMNPQPCKHGRAGMKHTGHLLDS